MIEKYIGMQYDIRNINGVNCWGLYCLVMLNERSKKIDEIRASSSAQASAIFAAKLATGDHGLIEVKQPKNFDLALVERSSKKGSEWHCGVYYNGGILHAKGSGCHGSVWYDSIIDFSEKYENMGYWRDNL